MSSILLVEDDKGLLKIISFFLEKQGFLISPYDNPEKALRDLKFREIDYDVILSDIMMEKMNGFEFCEAVKSIDKYKSLPFMFISALQDMESKIKGFNLGIDDYIEKPAELEMLELKIRNLITRYKKESELREQVDEAQESAKNIMSFYSDLGGVLEFYKETVGAVNIEELTYNLFKTLEGYGVKASICYYFSNDSLGFTCQGSISPLELDVMKVARTKTRFYTCADKLFLNYPDFTLFIKKMPADSDRAGILRDSIGVLANGVEAQLKNIIASEIVQKNNLKSLDSEKILDNARELQNKLELTIINAIGSLQQEVEEAFLTLGLSESQEEQIINLINSCDEDIQSGLQVGKELVGHVDQLASNLRDMRSN